MCVAPVFTKKKCLLKATLIVITHQQVRKEKEHGSECTNTLSHPVFVLPKIVTLVFIATVRLRISPLSLRL